MFEVTQDQINRQLENEKEQIQDGIKRYQKNLERLQAKGDFGATIPGRWFIETCFPAVVAKFEAEIDNALSGKPGRRMAAMKYLSLLSGEILTFLTLRVTIDAVMQKKNEKTRIAQRIGSAVQEELHQLAMKADKTKTKAFKYWTNRAETASHDYTKKRCREKLKSLYDPKIFEAIDVKDRTDMGVTCIEFVKQTVPDAFVEELRPVRNSDHPAYFLTLSTLLSGQIQEINKHMEPLWPIHNPTIIPPAPWTRAYQGGYHGEVGRRTKLVRTSKRHYLEELDNHADKLDTVFKALNAIQSTPWRINKHILAAMEAASKCAAPTRYSLPDPNDKPLPPKLPEGLGDDDAAKKQKQTHAFAIQEVRDYNAIAYSTRLSFSYLLAVARKFMDEEAIYFPHNLDWRGRLYPMASHLTPQGSDLSRSLLEFARGLPLETPQAAGWLAVHGANCFGYDKVPFEERIAWVQEHEEQIRAAAADPMACDWWAKEADSPWMFLAWCFEWVGYLDNGLAHVSHIPVAMDGSCNGLQNFAAMLRHEGTARAVNLAPAERPNDIYKQVADIVAVRVQALADTRDESAEALHEIVKERTNREINAGAKGDKDKKATGEMWNVVAAKWITGQITRNLVKQPVMTYPYAVSVFGIKEQLTKALREMNRAGKLAFPYEHASKIAFMLKEIVYQTVREEVKAAAEAMDWLKHVAEVVSEYNLPIAWVSPAGLPVVQEYKVKKGKQLNTQVGKQRIQLRVVEEGDAIDARSQASAIAPNFVHSCDASHLMLTVNASNDLGIQDFHMIHDSYGTHAANTPALAKTLREQFINIYSGNVLAEFRAYILKALPSEAESKLQEPPEQGNFDLSEVLNSKYFFI